MIVLKYYDNHKKIIYSKKKKIYYCIIHKGKDVF